MGNIKELIGLNENYTVFKFKVLSLNIQNFNLILIELVNNKIR